ncbi:MAG: ribonuclease HII [Chloroflexi bacterium]|nr:ribonuclease HII [Chloroflexota bacterium]
MASLLLETAVYQQHNITHIAGIDEAGRGALAGPVVAAAVILPRQNNIKTILNGVNDSKQLSAKKRDLFYDLIIEHALAYGIGQQSASVIDEIGIMPANKLAMQTAVCQLIPTPDFLLIDGRIRLPQLNILQKAIVRGDSKSLSIAAASILAKVTRDRFMIALDKQRPRYGFAQHKGYGTQQHRDAIAQHGPCSQHRHSFAPIRQTLL